MIPSLEHILNQQYSSNIRERCNVKIHVKKNKIHCIEQGLELMGRILKLVSQSIKGKQQCQVYVKNNKGPDRTQPETTQHVTRES